MKTTDELFNILKNESINSYLKNNENELINNPICKYLNMLIDEKNLVKADMIKKSNIQINYAYQILSGLKFPSRDKLIALCFGAELNIDETQTLLKYSGYAPLYPRNKRDSIIISSLKSHASVIDCNILLDEYDLSPI